MKRFFCKYPLFPTAAPAYMLFFLCMLAVSVIPAISGNELGELTEDEDSKEIVASAVLSEQTRKAGREVTIHLALEIPDNMYVYAHMMEAGLADDDNETPFRVLEVAWPEPQKKIDPHLEEEVEYYDGSLEFDMILRISAEAAPGETQMPVFVGYQACTEDLCFMPEKQYLSLSITVMESDDLPEDGVEREEDSTFMTGAARFTQRLEGSGIFMILLISYLAGLGLSLTPCVYPMIPVTIAVIGATETETRLGAFLRSMIYVLGIALTYAFIGVLAAASGAAFGVHLQHPYVYVALALLFFVFALSMFGLFEINMAMGRLSRLQARLKGKAGLAGILATGMLSGVIVTSCSAPIVFAALGFIVASGDLLRGFLIFSAIAWGMGTPLVLAGTFSGALQAMPKSGGWQNTIKNLMGLALVGASLYFIYLSAMLQPNQLSLLFAAVLVVISVFVGAFDRIVFSDGAWSRGRKAAGILVFFAALYLVIPQLGLQQPRDVQEQRSVSMEWLELEEGLELAEEQGRPIFLYFSTEHCPACRRLERRTFPNPEVVAAAEKFVTVKYDAVPLHGEGSEEVGKVLSEFGVRGFPTILFTEPGGNVVERLTEAGFLNADDMIKLLEEANSHFF